MALVVAALLGPDLARATDPAGLCASRKLREAGKYAACRMQADSKGVRRGKAPDFAKCQARFSKKWNSLEAGAGPGICPSEGDEASMDARVADHTGELATLLDGGVLHACGDMVAGRDEQCDGTDLGGADCTALGFSGGTLDCFGSCHFDTSLCTGGPGSGLFVGSDPILPKTGQTTSYGAGSDGDVQAGRSLSYVDNGDGTITDLGTGLIWEKKDDSGGVHDQDTTYTWSTGTGFLDGSVATEFLDVLNDVGGGGASCFAGSCNWRLPNVQELRSILDYGTSGPCVDPVFHQVATCSGCVDVTLATCSCTRSGGEYGHGHYWSSTTLVTDPDRAWYVTFNDGRTSSGLGGFKTDMAFARAVRGGL